jgi:hypothetical protein
LIALGSDTPSGSRTTITTSAISIPDIITIICCFCV